MVHNWFHKFVRSKTNPIGEDSALKWKRRLSIAYGVLAWNAIGLIAYSAFKGKADWADYYGLKSEEEKKISPAVSWANTLGIKNAKVYRVSGYTKVGEYEIVEGEDSRKREPETNTELTE